MESIVRNVRDINSNDRRVLEHVLGQPLTENQQVVVQIVTPEKQLSEAVNGEGPDRLPEWCNVYEGLSDEQIAGIEEVILQRADLTRASE